MRSFLFIAFFWLITFWIVTNKHAVTQKNRSLYAQPISVKYFIFGYNESFADSLWIRTLQDLGLCEQKLNPDATKRMGLDHTADCEKGWGFHMLDLITDLAPRFKTAHVAGPISLSVVADDIKGASVIFDKSVKNFPDDWSMQFRAAYHALSEEEDFLKAARLLRRAGDLGAPKWVYSLSAKLYTKAGRATVGRIVLEDYLKRVNKNIRPEDLKKIKNRLYELNETIRSEKNEN